MRNHGAPFSQLANDPCLPQYELDLPIEVKQGTIGRVALNIPWSGLYTESVIVTIEVRK